MKLHELHDNEGANRKKKRIGRGPGSGKGKTGGRGIKGQKSRSGVAINGYEGGQMPLQRRVPKFGFKNPNRVEYKGINLDTIQALVEKTGLKAVAPADLIANGLANKHDLVKILGRGELTAGVEVSAHQFSKSATAAIEGAGGKCSTIDRHAK